MNRAEVESKVKLIVSAQLGVFESEIEAKSRFIQDFSADSLDTVELVMEFEDEFDISISDEKAESILTVGAAIDAICTMLADKGKLSA